MIGVLRVKCIVQSGELGDDNKNNAKNKQRIADFQGEQGSRMPSVIWKISILVSIIDSIVCCFN